MNLVPRFLMLALLLASWPALAQSPEPANLPEWEQLSPAQRQALIAPLRQRWNSEPEQRARMLRHAQRWQSMTPEQRRAAHRGVRRFQQMTPERREEARALFQAMRTLDPEQRARLREQWQQMTPQQRRQWVEEHAPPIRPARSP